MGVFGEVGEQVGSFRHVVAGVLGTAGEGDFAIAFAFIRGAEGFGQGVAFFEHELFVAGEVGEGMIVRGALVPGLQVAEMEGEAGAVGGEVEFAVPVGILGKDEGEADAVFGAEVELGGEPGFAAAGLDEDEVRGAGEIGAACAACGDEAGRVAGEAEVEAGVGAALVGGGATLEVDVGEGGGLAEGRAGGE